MSLFKSSGIILKITSLNENEFLFDVFTYEYGKLKITHNKDINEYKILVRCSGRMCRREVYSIGNELAMDVFKLVINKWNGEDLKEE